MGIIDLPGSNSVGVQAAFARIGVKAVILRDARDVQTVERIVLPGVGSFGPASEFLANSGFFELIIDRHQRELPILGICLGFQLFCNTSAEGHGKRGLGLIPAEVRRLKGSPGSRVPNMGWRPLTSVSEAPHYSLAKGASFYFSHSFEVVLESPSFAFAYAQFENEEILAASAVGNLIGVQFHPEKSHDAGLEFLKLFASRDG